MALPARPKTSLVMIAGGALLVVVSLAGVVNACQASTGIRDLLTIAIAGACLAAGFASLALAIERPAKAGDAPQPVIKSSAVRS